MNKKQKQQIVDKVAALGFELIKIYPQTSKVRINDKGKIRLVHWNALRKMNVPAPKPAPKKTVKPKLPKQPKIIKDIIDD